MIRSLIAFAAAGLLAACTVGPDYKRPEAELPADFGVAQSPSPAPEMAPR